MQRNERAQSLRLGLAMIENQIINKAIDFIFSHIDEELSVDSIAGFCGYSKFYLSRLFKAETGESIYGFIKRTKIEQSAWRLKVEQGRSITEISGEYGYSASNYATLFRDYFEKTPAEFRRKIVEESVAHPFYHGVENKLESFEECCEKISVEYLPDYFVLYERRKGNYHNLEDDWCEFMEHYKDFVTPKTIFIERTINDPAITNPDECLYEVCMTVDKNDKRLEVQKTAAAGITSKAGTLSAPNTMILEGGKFAVYHYKGYPQMIYGAIQSFFCSWLTQTGNKVDNRSGFDIYRKMDDETLYMELDICIPIV